MEWEWGGGWGGWDKGRGALHPTAAQWLEPPYIGLAACSTACRVHPACLTRVPWCPCTLQVRQLLFDLESAYNE